MNSRSRVVILVVALLVLILLVISRGQPQNLFGGRSGSQLQSDLLQQAKHDFSEVNDKAGKDYGFTFKEPTRANVSCYNSHDAMDSRHYDTCQIYNRAEPVIADSAFITQWRRTSPAFEKWLQDNGWHKTWNENQPIAQILDKPQNDTSIGVNYDKKTKGIVCTVTFMWVQPYDPNQITASEQCSGTAHLDKI